MWIEEATDERAYEEDTSSQVNEEKKNADAHLPEGWSEFHDEEGNPYYYQETTGRTSWTPPGSP